MFWRAVVRDFGTASKRPKDKWAHDLQVLVDSFRSLSTGKSWSGNERNHLFLGDGRDFTRVTGISGTDDPADSRGFALIDYNRDGALDIALLNLGKPRVRLLKNDAVRRGNGFIAVRFEGGNRSPRAGTGWSSRDGYGAVVELELSDGRKIYREHRTEDGFMTQHTSTMVIGIGTGEVKSMTVRWPSGRVQARKGVERGVLVTATERGSLGTSSYR